MSRPPEELALEVELRRPRRRRRDPLLGGRLGRRGKGQGRGGETLLFGGVARRQRSTVKVSYAARGGAPTGPISPGRARSGRARRGGGSTRIATTSISLRR